MSASDLALVKSIIAEQFAFPEEELSESTHLYNEIGVDSAALFELAVRLEDTIEIRIKSFEKIKTVGDILSHVARTKGG